MYSIIKTKLSEGVNMADEANVDDTTIVDTTADETIVADTTDYKALYEAEQATIEKLKLDNAGLDRKIGELSKAEKERLIASETAQETAKREAEEARQAIETRKNELTTKESDLISKETAFNVKLEAVNNGYTIADIEELGFTSVEQVQKHKAWVDKKTETVKSETTKNIEKGLSGLDQKNYKNDNKTEELSPLEKKIISRR